MQQVRFSLIENAESFVRESLAKAILAESDPLQWKYAILNLVQALELALKEILRREHWTLVFQNVDKPASTVSLEGALNRLKTIARIDFDHADVEAVRSAIDLRNKVVHFEFSFEGEKVKLVFGKLLGFAQHCFGQYLGRALHEVAGDLWAEAIFLLDYVDEIYKRAEDRIRSEGITIVFTCNQCDSDAFVPRSTEGVCYVCGHSEEVSQCAACGYPIYEDSGAWVDDKGLQCCNACLSVGVIVSSGEASRVTEWEEIENEEGEIFLKRRPKEAPNSGLKRTPDGAA